MITNRLYVQRMITFSVHEVVFIDTWRLNADVCTVNAPDHTREAVLGEEGLFDHSFAVFIRPNNAICWRRTRACDTAVMHCETVDFGSPNVSPITSRKLPDAKKRKATRT